MPTTPAELARMLTLVHARARAANHLLARDPAAASRALQEVTACTRAALEALQRVTGPAPGLAMGRALASLTGGRGGLPGLRGVGGAFRFAAVGPERPLSPQADQLLARVVGRCLASTAEHVPGAAVSVSMTWSAAHLDVMVAVTAAPHTGGTPEVAPGHRDWSSEVAAAAALGGSLRAHRQLNGGVLALRLTDQASATPHPELLRR